MKLVLIVRPLILNISKLYFQLYNKKCVVYILYVHYCAKVLSCSSFCKCC